MDFTITLYLLGLLAAPVLIFRALYVRNSTAPADRAHGLIYITRAIAQAFIVWAVISSITAVVVQFWTHGGARITAPILAYAPWDVPFAASDETDPYGISIGFTDLTFAPVNGTVPTKVLIAAGLILLQVAPAAMAFLVVRVCSTVLAGKPFVDKLVALSWWTAGLVFAAGILGQLAIGFGGFLAAHDVLDWLGSTTSQEMPVVLDPLQAGIDLWPLYAALGIAVVAVLLKYGTRMQKDTELLV